MRRDYTPAPLCDTRVKRESSPIERLGANCIQNILGLAVYGKPIVAALKGNLHRITHQIRGSLNSVMSMVIAELNRGLNPANCGETRWCGSLLGSWYSPITSERKSTRLIKNLEDMRNRSRHIRLHDLPQGRQREIVLAPGDGLIC